MPEDQIQIQTLGTKLGGFLGTIIFFGGAFTILYFTVTNLPIPKEPDPRIKQARAEQENIRMEQRLQIEQKVSKEIAARQQAEKYPKVFPYVGPSHKIRDEIPRQFGSGNGGISSEVQATFDQSQRDENARRREQDSVARASESARALQEIQQQQNAIQRDNREILEALERQKLQKMVDDLNKY
jgi:hypothetical protein